MLRGHRNGPFTILTLHIYLFLCAYMYIPIINSTLMGPFFWLKNSVVWAKTLYMYMYIDWDEFLKVVDALEVVHLPPPDPHLVGQHVALVVVQWLNLRRNNKKMKIFFFSLQNCIFCTLLGSWQPNGFGT